MTEPGVVRTGRWVAFFRAGFAVLWLVWAAAAWWSAPRAVGADQLTADLAAGKVASYSRAESFGRPGPWAAQAQVRHGSSGGILVWRTTSGQTLYIELGPLSDQDNGLEELIGQVERAGVGYGGDGWAWQLAAVSGVMLVVGALGTLLGGPDPVRGTRWFWFWVGQLPLGVGFLAWLWRERPWVAAPMEPPERRSGWIGVGLLIIGGALMFGLVAVARSAFGSWLVPD